MTAWPLFSLLPARCVFCTRPAPPEGLCDGCRDDLGQLGPACPRCAEPGISGSPAECRRCRAAPPPWRRCRAVLPYAWPADQALIRLKFSRELSIAPALGGLLRDMALRDFADVDALCPVPLHRLRHVRRGFNQALELCRPLLAASGLPLLAGVRRVRNTPPQSGMDRRARQDNLRSAFVATRRLASRHALIVDDVMTTGETCRQLAATLLAGGVQAVSVLVVARAASPDQAGD